MRKQARTHTICHNTIVKMHAKLQFRSAGPMILERPTKDELAHLRQIASSSQPSSSRIKYIRLIHDNNNASITIWAQANIKLSVKAWRSHLGKRIQHIRPATQSTSCPPAPLDSMMVVEVFGRVSQKSPACKQEEPAHALPVVGGIKPSPSESARLAFLQTLSQRL